MGIQQFSTKMQIFPLAGRLLFEQLIVILYVFDFLMTIYQEKDCILFLAG